VGTLLRPPLSPFRWTVIRTDGSRQAIIPGTTRRIDIDPSSPGQVFVEFTLRDQAQTCQIEGSPRDSGQFTLRVEVDEFCGNTLFAERIFALPGGQTEVFGFDHWLNMFEKLMTMAAIERNPFGSLDTDPLPIDLFDPAPEPGVLPGTPPSEDQPGRPPSGGRRGSPGPIALAPGKRSTFPSRPRRSLRPGVSAFDLLERDPQGLRGLQLGALDSPKRRSTPPALFTLQARHELGVRLERGFQQLHQRFGKNKQLARFEKQLRAIYARLPDPAELLKQLEQRDRDLR
jgi:hypothetical protein